jgi:5-methylcytosine-specific restriction endonuclease McrA
VLVRLCPRCGAQVPVAGLCPVCTRRVEAGRGTRTERGYNNQWLRLVKVAIAQHPYCSVPGCTSTDLTGDHALPLAMGGKSVLENIQVLCRRHNSMNGSSRSSRFFERDHPEPPTRDSRKIEPGVPNIG